MRRIPFERQPVWGFGHDASGQETAMLGCYKGCVERMIAERESFGKKRAKKIKAWNEEFFASLVERNLDS